MNETILLGVENKFTAKANFWLFMLVGLLFLLNGSYTIYNSKFDPIGFVLGSLIVVGGVFYIVYGQLAFSKKSKFAPRVKVNDEEIELRSSVFKPVIKILWSDVKRIEFGLYELDFQLADKNLIFNYESSLDASLNIKGKILDMANEKSIEVVSG